MSYSKETRRSPKMVIASRPIHHLDGNCPRDVGETLESRIGLPLEGREVDAGTNVQEIASCDICGATMIGAHCKLRCVRCGYSRDCSDP